MLNEVGQVAYFFSGQKKLGWPFPDRHTQVIVISYTIGGELTIFQMRSDSLQ